ncbi:uncharacterized protein RAG0_00058 [Rhynchosporium agropyri]|uniref:Uncharacterized protein n=1 Tax=Rhynchosporium agropyri TaxID=914238 RepID=A0A1E1JVQ6_9HELO|nr:uncharacterized protein RAG0_00058 [Rhynchosporium agropyri]
MILARSKVFPNTCLLVMLSSCSQQDSYLDSCYAVANVDASRQIYGPEGQEIEDRLESLRDPSQRLKPVYKLFAAILIFEILTLKLGKLNFTGSAFLACDDHDWNVLTYVVPNNILQFDMKSSSAG